MCFTGSREFRPKTRKRVATNNAANAHRGKKFRGRGRLRLTMKTKIASRESGATT